MKRTAIGYFACWICQAICCQAWARGQAQTQGPFQPGKLYSRVVCKEDPSQSYALYIPTRGNPAPRPVVYMFDPHADGKLPLNKYRRLAEEYGFILVGSNNSKNGNEFSTTDNIWMRLSEDTKGRLPIDGARMYTCGFSGGAKVASFIAMKTPQIKGVIAGGAGLPDGAPAGMLPFSFTGIAGEGDMNLTDLVALNEELGHNQNRHRLLIFEGKHEWAPEYIMRIAFAGLELDAMQQALTPKNDAFINRYVTGSQGRFEDLMRTGKLIKAMSECEVSASYLEGFPGKAAWFKEKAASLANNARYRQQRQLQSDMLARESSIKAGYMQQFQQGDTNYWTRTIRDLQTRSALKNVETGMNQRLLAYLSLAFYSISNRLVAAGRDADARHFVDLYKLADPTNSEAWYLSAILYARQNQGGLADKELLQAVKCGFADKARLMNQSEFRSTSVKIHLGQIEEGMKKGN